MEKFTMSATPAHIRRHLSYRSFAARPAFTLVELLVVIAIIGILIAMTLPAINATRETARRSQCLQNMSQLGIALQNYQMAHEVLPSGTIDKQGPIHSVASGDHRSWIIHLLPYLEELPAYHHLDQAAGVYSPINDVVRNTPIAVLQCPSDPNSPGTPPVSNYVAVHHDVEAPIDVDNHGTFFLNSHLRYDDITDGPSHTLFLGEKLCDSGDLGWLSGTRATLRNTGTPLNTPLPPALLGVSPAPTNSPAAESPNTAPPTDSPPANTDSDASAAPAAPAPTTPALPADLTLYVGGFASSHPAGANFAFGDGSVRFITETINLQILQQLANRADGKLLPANF
jgi:prepilin-type N-terminal cleavage/methylation domain-containing protein/prepilin-type processing-associated H-X9-DG protein